MENSYDSFNENVPVYSVNEISNSVKRVIEDRFSKVYIKGEIGRVSKPYSGHIYFDLKDEKSVLSSVVWKGNVKKLSLLPEEGIEVKALGKLTTFHGQSKYQLVIENLIPSGVGALMALMEKRKEKFKNLGYFDEHLKKKIPFIPAVIGVVTSPSGAVIEDIIHRVRDRFPSKILVWPVSVQGKNCSIEVSKAIDGFNSLTKNDIISKPDVIIIARGGGSVEDLWGFNEELVTVSVFKSSIPIISAIGHETDWTLVDFVSDLRAPTPSAAAEMVVPVRLDLYEKLKKINNQLDNNFFHFLRFQKNIFQNLLKSLPKVEDLFLKKSQHFDNLNYKFLNSLNLFINKKKLDYMSLRLEKIDLIFFQTQINQKKKELKNYEKNLNIFINNFFEINKKSFSDLARLHNNLSYKNTLSRGYVVVRDDKKSIVKNKKEIEKKEYLELEFIDGFTRVKSVKE